MTRNLIFVSPNDRRTYRNIRTGFHGYPVFLLAKSATADLKIDFTNYLNSGETISSVTVSTKGLSVSSANTTTTVTLTLSGVSGETYFDILVTFSTGILWSERIIVRNERRYPSSADESSGDYERL